ncbi:MAG: Rha family transcriptional regulator, partial [Clostridiaceae bacterium]|nr:Rha family transcriptional regulator [Clostridiaceae bacterium]
MNKLENRISSREVAEMMCKQHKHVLEKIDKLNEDLISLNLGQSKYWVESSFVDDKNRTYREYKITELGCELIAHKTIGKDGTAFTVKYMDRFHKMKEIIEENKPQLPTDYLSALKALVASEEEKQQLQLENIDKINEHLISLNLGQSKYWVESSFVDDKNRTYRE